jgi:hypothetical protein
MEYQIILLPSLPTCRSPCLVLDLCVQRIHCLKVVVSLLGVIYRCPWKYPIWHLKIHPTSKLLRMLWCCNSKSLCSPRLKGWSIKQSIKFVSMCFSHSSFYAHDKYKNDVCDHKCQLGACWVPHLLLLWVGGAFVDVSKTLEEHGVVQRFRV